MLLKRLLQPWPFVVLASSTLIQARSSNDLYRGLNSRSEKRESHKDKSSSVSEKIDQCHTECFPHISKSHSRRRHNHFDHCCKGGVSSLKLSFEGISSGIITTSYEFAMFWAGDDFFKCKRTSKRTDSSNDKSKSGNSKSKRSKSGSSKSSRSKRGNSKSKRSKNGSSKSSSSKSGNSKSKRSKNGSSKSSRSKSGNSKSKRSNSKSSRLKSGNSKSSSKRSTSKSKASSSRRHLLSNNLNSAKFSTTSNISTYKLLSKSKTSLYDRSLSNQGIARKLHAGDNNGEQLVVKFAPCESTCFTQGDCTEDKVTEEMAVQPGDQLCLALYDGLNNSFLFDQKFPRTLDLYFLPFNGTAGTLYTSIVTSCSKPIYPSYASILAPPCSSSDNTLVNLNDELYEPGTPYLKFIDGTSVEYFSTGINSDFFSFTFGRCGCECPTLSLEPSASPIPPSSCEEECETFVENYCYQYNDGNIEPCHFVGNDGQHRQMLVEKDEMELYSLDYRISYHHKMANLYEGMLYSTSFEKRKF